MPIRHADRSVSAAAILAVLALCSCSRGGAGQNDPTLKAAAIQKTLSGHATAAVLHGRRCMEPWPLLGPPPGPHAYEQTPRAHVTSDGLSAPDFTRKRYPCFSVTWDSAVATPAGDCLVARLGHYVVDKVGDEQDGPGGARVSPYRAHFEPNPTGTALMAAQFAARRPDIADVQAILHKESGRRMGRRFLAV